AEPLVNGGIVYAATLNNTVYALNQADGSVVWSNHLAAPETGGWQCGGFTQGILGTPVIDTLAGRIYVADLEASDDLYRVYGLNLASGAAQLPTVIPLTIGDGTFDRTIQQQRGALAVANGYVYVPFGGRAGDCGSYHGWVVGVPTDGVSPLKVYETPTTASGIWAPGGVVIDDATGGVIFATGNAIPCAGTSDAVVRANGTLSSTTFFQPQDWSSHWCGPDEDLGSASPILINPNLAFTSGKYGQGFLLDPNNLGGVNGQLFPARSPYVGADVCVGNHANATFGSFAFANGRVYLECHGHGVVSLSLNTSTPSFSLCDAICAAPSWHTVSGTFGPPIVAGGVVWAIDINGSGLWGWDANTGAKFFQSATSFGVNHFVTPSEAGSQLFVPAGTMIRSFVMHTGAPQVPPVAPVPRASAGQVGAPPAPGRPPAPQVSPIPPLPR
ncbi:MAG TPA: PQQ-binding-like beta-propeller repeat protein, partial [Candidatus Acidoferrales bacterium]|nr:PQQ-binding-like beta-propeller repeat protein [Candidatus Acidoferrales bacterium]